MKPRAMAKPADVSPAVRKLLLDALQVEDAAMTEVAAELERAEDELCMAIEERRLTSNALDAYREYERAATLSGVRAP